MLTEIGAATPVGAYDASKVSIGSIHADTLTLSSTAAGAYTAISTAKNVYSGQDGYDLISVPRTIGTPGSAAGDIVLDNSISWTRGTLAIDTSGTVTQTTAISGTGTAIFEMRSGTWRQVNATLPAFDVRDFRITGGSFVRVLSGNGTAGAPYQLDDIYGVQGMGSSGMTGLHYALARDIDATGTADWNAGEGFTSIGAGAAKFTGSLDGLGHTIDGLYIRRPYHVGAGLFGWTDGAQLRNVGLTNVDVTASDDIAALAGHADGNTSIANSFASGTVTSTMGTGNIGGLLGYLEGTLDNSYAAVTVEGQNSVGGLVGFNQGSITNSYATGDVNGYSDDAVGGLVGLNRGSVSHSYSTGRVQGPTQGGLIGKHLTGTVADSYWDIETSEQAASAGGAGAVGKTTAEMQQLTTFDSWDIDDAGGTGKVWRIYEGHTYPLLRSLLRPLTVTIADASKPYDGLPYNAGISVTYSTPPVGPLQGTLSPAGSAQGAINVGSYTFSASGLWSKQQGYDIAYDDGTLTITPAPLTITANDASKTYDGQAFNGGNVTYTGFVNGETEAVLSGTLAYGGNAQGAVNAGSYDITPSGLTSANYAITYADGTLTVNKAALTVTANDASKPYDGLAYTGGNGVTYSGFVNGETDAVLGGTLTYSGTAQGAVNPGTYTITPAGLTSGNYLITFADGALAIDKALLTITANDASKTYDGLAFFGGNGVTYSGFVNGDTAAVLGGTLTYGGSAQGAVNAGTYTLTPAGLTSGTYTITYADGQLSIAQAPLTVTANDASKTYDGVAYAGGNGVTFNGLVNGETAAVLNGTLMYGGSSQGARNAGTYAITPSGLTANNYAIAYADGTLTVDKAQLTVTADDASRTYGAADPAFSATLSGFVNGETLATAGVTGKAALTPAADINSGVGSYAIQAAQGSLSAANYDFAFVDGVLTITPASLTITAKDATKTFDGVAYIGGNGVTYSGFVNGETDAVLGGTLAYGGSAQGAVDTGTYAITPSGLTSDNYAIAYADGQLTIRPHPMTWDAYIASVSSAHKTTRHDPAPVAPQGMQHAAAGEPSGTSDAQAGSTVTAAGRTVGQGAANAAPQAQPTAGQPSGSGDGQTGTTVTNADERSGEPATNAGTVISIVGSGIRLPAGL